MEPLLVDDRVSAALKVKADLQWLTVAAYLEDVAFSRSPELAQRLSLDEFDRFLDEEAIRGPSPIGTFSREELYDDHD